MTDTIGRGVIEIAVDARKLRAGIDDAKRSIRSLGEGQRDVSRSAQASIDRYISRLQVQNATLGKSARETELFKLAFRGASNEQLKAADAALRFREAQERNIQSIGALKSAFLTLGTIAAAGLIGAAAAFDTLVKKVGDFQDLAEKVGDTAENLASLSVAASVGGKSMDEVGDFAIKMNKALTGVDDESEKAGAAIKALGLDIDQFKQLRPSDQLDALAKALDQFEDGQGKSNVMEALARGGAQLLPFLKELSGETGRQNILTAQQIKLADEYSDKQARAKAQISLHAQAIATELLPQISNFIGGLAEIIKGQDFASTASSTLQNVLNGAIVVFQTLAVVVSDVAFVFHELGRGIGAAGANLAAIARLDFQGVRTIFKEVSADSEAARVKLDKFQASIMALGQVGEFANVKTGRSSSTDKPRRTLDFSGAVKAPKSSTDNSAEQEARAQLEFDLAQIRKATDAQIDTFANAQRIMEAQRQADLVNDREYYAEKKRFIEQNAEAQERGLQAEIERLGREKFSGKGADKERIDNQRKIADAEAKIAKIRADATASLQVNSIQEQAALKRVQQAYDDARASAQAYLETVQRQNAREIQGIGRGNKFREEQSGISQIEDRQIVERKKLEGDLRRGQIDRSQFDQYLAVVNETYAKEIELYRQRTAAIDEAQANWLNGATEALQNYVDETRNIAKQVEDALGSAFKGAEDALVEFSRTGKLNFKDLADSIVDDINRILIRQNITGPLAEFLQGNLGSIGGFFGLPTGASGGAGKAVGDAANAATFGTAVASASATFTAETTAAGAAFSAEAVAAGATLTAEVAAGGATFAAEAATAGAVFAGEVAAAGAAFTAAVAASSVTSAASSSAGSVIGSLFAAEGGLISGPGTATSDSIPTMLSNKEFVIRAAQVAQPGTLDFLQTINEDGLSSALDRMRKDAKPAKGATVIPFARGGIIRDRREFPLEQGKGLVGETGAPEAIMPLRRAESGQQGVIVAGLPGVTLPVIRDIAGNMAVDLPVSVAARVAAPATERAQAAIPDVRVSVGAVAPVVAPQIVQAARAAGVTERGLTGLGLHLFPGRGDSTAAGQDVPVSTRLRDQRTASVSRVSAAAAALLSGAIAAAPPGADQITQMSRNDNVAGHFVEHNLSSHIAPVSIQNTIAQHTVRQAMPPASAISNTATDVRNSITAGDRYSSVTNSLHGFSRIHANTSSVSDTTFGGATSIANQIGGASSIANHNSAIGGSSNITTFAATAAPAVTVAPVLGSFETGIAYVPETGIYQLHEGERVVPKAENAQGGVGQNVTININQSFAPGTDSKTTTHAAVEASRRVGAVARRGYT
jgi:lambda family phage tail tape measure protein